METIHERINFGEISKTVNTEKQNRHIRNSGAYLEGRSYLLDGIDPQGLVDRYHGTGEAKFTEAGRWKNKELIDADRIIGISINPATGEETATKRFVIHYSKTGVHIVPAERR